ncbi:hypothetical protein [Hymenobacter sp. YC55]|uniref:hypothetical protein n=1 Tax=Hymenobacter sp. YC55 TaxID=3034019 RepID=UPI0023F9EBDB|nr:hypothetical protein [Hymenobacter sp. YC55]MDF7813761.1 hypothetical protein [Hymenobacter sp. YC55]
MTLDKKAFSVLAAASRSSREHVLIALIIKERKHDISLSEGLHEVLREVVLVRNIEGDGSPPLQQMNLPARGVAKDSGAGPYVCSS